MDRQVFNNVTGMYHFRVACVSFYPWAMLVNGPDGPKMEGMFFEVIDTLARSMKFTFDYISSEDLKFGIYLGNDTYNGIAGQIQRKEVDMLTPWVIGPHRDAHITPSEVTFFTVCKIFASVGKLEASNFIGFLTTFDLEIWYFLLGLLFMIIGIAAVSDVLLLRKEVHWRYVKRELIYYFWMFVSALFCEGSFRTPASRRSQFLLGLWLMAMLILMNAFCGQFKALLMKKNEEPEIRNNEDLAERTYLDTYLGEETQCALNYELSNKKSYRTVWKKIVSQEKKTILHVSKFQQMPVFQLVKDGKAVIFYEQAALKSFLMNTCEQLVGNRRIYLSKEDDSFCIINIAIRDDLPREWIDKFNLRIIWMKEGDVINKLIRDNQWKYKKCEDVIDDPFNGIKLANLLPVFFLLLIVDGFALLILLAEICVHQFNQCKSSNSFL